MVWILFHPALNTWYGANVTVIQMGPVPEHTCHILRILQNGSRCRGKEVGCGGLVAKCYPQDSQNHMHRAKWGGHDSSSFAGMSHSILVPFMISPSLLSSFVLFPFLLYKCFSLMLLLKELGLINSQFFLNYLLYDWIFIFKKFYVGELYLICIYNLIHTFNFFHPLPFQKNNDLQWDHCCLRRLFLYFLELIIWVLKLVVDNLSRYIMSYGHTQCEKRLNLT